MDPGTLTALSIGMSILGGVGSLVKGIASSNAASAEAAQYQDQQRQAKLAADNDELVRRQDLTRSLAAQDAAGAGMGMDISRSGSFMALQSGDRAVADRMTLLNKAGYDSTVQRLGMQAAGARAASGSDLIGGLTSFGSSMFDAYDKYHQLKMPAK